jgi:hypothetical protein
VPAFEAESFDIGADRLGDPQPIQRQQAHERVITGTAQSGSDQHGAHLVAVQPNRVGLVVKTRPPDMHRRRDADEAFMLGVPIETSDRTQTPSKCCPRPAPSLQLTAEPLDVRAARTKQRDLMFGAPLHPLAQIELVGLTGQAAVPSEETEQGFLLDAPEERLAPHQSRGRNGNNLHVTPPGSRRHDDGPNRNL